MKIFGAKGLNFLHFNVSSLQPKIDQIHLLTYESKVGVLCLSETCLDISISDYEITVDNYSLVHIDRNHNSGGVCIYITSDLNFIVEIVLIDICLTKIRPGEHPVQ